MAADSVRLAVATGRTQRAESVVSATDHLARRTGVALYEGVALRCRGLHERDIVTLGDAVHALCRSERPMDLAAAREDIGRELGRAGRVQEAHPLLEEALATYERVGAALGHNPGRRPPPQPWLVLSWRGRRRGRGRLLRPGR